MDANDKPTVVIERLEGADPEVPLPAYRTAGAAGADLAANFPEGGREGIALAPGARALVPLGFRMALPQGFEAQIRARSGLALRRGLMLPNAPGTIDADYRGEVGVIVMNGGTEMVRIAHGMRIAQMVIAPVARATFETGSVEATARGAGGFGSTGTGP